MPLRKHRGPIIHGCRDFLTEQRAGALFGQHAARAGCNISWRRSFRGVGGEPNYDHGGETRLMSAVPWMPLRRIWMSITTTWIASLDHPRASSPSKASPNNCQTRMSREDRPQRASHSSMSSTSRSEQLLHESYRLLFVTHGADGSCFSDQECGP
jgi:hypothetical protein